MYIFELYICGLCVRVCAWLNESFCLKRPYLEVIFELPRPSFRDWQCMALPDFTRVQGDVGCTCDSFFFVRLSLNQKEFYTNFLWQLNRPSNSSSLFTKLGSPVASSILLFFLIFVTFGLLSRSWSTWFFLKKWLSKIRTRE